MTPALAKGQKGRKTTENANSVPTTGTPRVAAGWQNKLITRLDEEKFDEAWGLFSEGGWSDVGQVMLLAKGDKNQFALLTVKPNEREKSDSRTFSKTQWNAIAATLDKAQGLQDIDEPMFDGLIYEYVHLKRDPSGQLQAVKRIYIKATGRIPHKDHDELVTAMQSLKESSS